MGSFFSVLCSARDTREVIGRKFISDSTSTITDSHSGLSDSDFIIDSKPVGKGAYGEVFSATHQSTGEVWAIKKFIRTSVDRYVRDECVNLAKCDCQHIITFKDVRTQNTVFHPLRHRFTSAALFDNNHRRAHIN
jgi:hypothetical protein